MQETSGDMRVIGQVLHFDTAHISFQRPFTFHGLSIQNEEARTEQTTSSARRIVISKGKAKITTAEKR